MLKHNLRKKPRLYRHSNYPREDTMKLLLQPIVRFLEAEEGPTAVEYAMLLMLIFLVCISVIVLLGQSTTHSFDHSGQQMESAMHGGN